MNAESTEVLVIGSGAGGATTAAKLAAAGRDVLVLEEGPWVEPDAVEPFTLEEMVLKYRHRGSCATLGTPPVAYAEGRCVGGSTEINSGLWHRLPTYLVDAWRDEYRIEEFNENVLDRYAAEVEDVLSVSTLPVAPPPSSAVLERGAAKLGWRAVEFPRVFKFDDHGRGVKQTMVRTMIPRAVAAGAHVEPNTRVVKLLRAGDRVVGALCEREHPDGGREPVTITADHVFVCAGAIQTPALLQRSGFRGQIGTGLKLHPTIKIAARFANPIDHAGVPMHRITEFAPSLTIGGSVSRKGHIALALSDSAADFSDALEDWERVFVYYAAIRGDASGRIIAVPGLRAPIVTYRLTDGDLSRLARGLIHLGESLLAAGATELYPSIIGGRVVRRTDELHQWWDGVTRASSNLMTVHLTSSVRMGEDKRRSAADSFGSIRGVRNLRVNDASLLPDAPGVNPQAAIMTIATRNAEHFLATAR